MVLFLAVLGQRDSTLGRAAHRMPVIERAVSLSVSRRCANCLPHESMRTLDRPARRHALSEAGCDRRCQRAAGAMRVPRLDAFAFEAVGLSVASDDIANDLAGEVTALQHDDLRAELQQGCSGFVHGGAI